MKDMSEYLSVLYFTSDLYTVIANFYLKKEEEKNMLMKTEKPEPKSSVTFFLNLTFKKKHVILKKTEHAAEQMSNKTKRKNKSNIVLYIILKSTTLCVQE